MRGMRRYLGRDLRRGLDRGLITKTLKERRAPKGFVVCFPAFLVGVFDDLVDLELLDFLDVLEIDLDLLVILDARFLVGLVVVFLGGLDLVGFWEPRALVVLGFFVFGLEVFFLDLAIVITVYFNKKSRIGLEGVCG